MKRFLTLLFVIMCVCIFTAVASAYTVSFVDENGNEIISDKRSLYVVESENKNSEEKFKIFLKNSYLVMHLKAAYTIKGLFEITIPDIITADYRNRRCYQNKNQAY